ncbi:MAG TPA: L,D-transpeptidase family protein [Woeseiaceae bacterium]|nr:L,D-transpeptidase family protein [Woeseiaceae bacterium]
MLPAALIRIPDSVSSVFVADVSTGRFHRFAYADGEIADSGSVYMSIGQAGVGKQRSGDRRTPIGVYFVTEKLDTTRLHEKYGVSAFVLDYPNTWDEREDRSGDGIWVHGVDPGGGKRPRQDTDGCIALPNEELLALIPEFEANVTPVVVTRDVSWVAATENDALRLELEEAVAAWADSQVEGDLYAYLKSYDEGFQRWGLSRAEWSLLKVRANKRAPDALRVSDLLLVRYPDEGEIYLSRFRLQRVGGGTIIEMMKRLYWHRTESGALRIIAENDG